MATHSSILAWEMAWTEEPGGLQSQKESDKIRQLNNSLKTEQNKTYVSPENIAKSPKQRLVAQTDEELLQFSLG